MYSTDAIKRNTAARFHSPMQYDGVKKRNVFSADNLF